MKTTAGPRIDSRDQPTYTPGEAAHCLGLPVSTVKVWSFGGKSSPPLFEPVRRTPPALSFWNLVELYVVASIRRRHGVSLQKLRRSIRYVKTSLGLDRPLIEEKFLTDGVSLFVKRAFNLINVSEEGQLAIEKVLEGALQRIERDPEGLAKSFYPWFKDPAEPREIVINPSISFGRPVLTGTGIPTETIAERFQAGESIGHLAEEYNQASSRIELALRWERRGLAA